MINIMIVNLQVFCTLCFGWYLFNLIEYSFHKLGHYYHPYNYVYYLHKNHHKDYPMTDLYSETYRGRIDGILAFFIPSIIITLFLYSLLDIYIFKIISGELVCLTIISDTLHTQIHTKKSVLERFKWFRENRRLHFIHHQAVNKNFSFAGLSHDTDKLLNTFRDY
jgi:sterol desaturase/sphingolipid hydroxylase (fatty acid hydroxylase superfamily)